MAKHHPMVGWYDPGQLVQTAIEVIVATIFGRHSDRRLLEALTSATLPLYEYDQEETIWIDYVADTGDGWNSTYAIASTLAKDDLTVKDRGGRSYVLPRGRLLVLGGDEVYPTASRESYQQRLCAPFAEAFPHSEEPHPEVFAIPGNHDWYDSLVSFSRLFCGGETRRRWLGGWRTRQSRSYFALRLPGKWWLLGTDIQLGSDLDEAQVAFFQGLKMDLGDRVILCNAVPEWIYQAKYGKWSPEYEASNLRFVEETLLGNRVAVVIAGDSHYYRRYSTADETRQRIVAGGGGAFTSPTHDLPRTPLPGGFEHRESFPDPDESRRYCWRNLAFPFLNPSFGMLSGVFYFFTAWTLLPISVIDTGKVSGHFFSAMIVYFGAGPGPLMWLFLVLGGFVLFTDTHSRRYRIVAGPLHGLAHVCAACTTAWILSDVVAPGATPSSVGALLRGSFVMVGTIAAGWLLGGFIMGLYLLISLNGFGRHANEAFSSLRCEDWKCFLRLRIQADGGLTIYPVGLRRIAHYRQQRVHGKKSRTAPPGLIDGPIEVPRKVRP